jgi:lipoyl(octanoyl) transferase
MKVQFHNIGIKDYKETWDFQEQLFQQVLDDKNAGKTDSINHLVFVEHPHVYTLGKSGSEENMLINYIQLQAKNAQFYKINRGGDITYHGPGQLVGYPIFNLTALNIGIKEYIWRLEQAVIDTVAEYGIQSARLDGATGVWLDIDTPRVRKICAIGVRTSHWVTMHGFALNVNTDLSYFGHINPCGFTDKTVTSLEKELGKAVDFSEVSGIALNKLQKLFGIEFCE